MLIGKLRALLFLLGRTRGWNGKLSLLSALVGGELSRPNRDSPRVRCVPFREFDLRFHVGQNELTLYPDLLRDTPAIVAAIGKPLRECNVLDVGANIGLFALFLKDARRIVSVEPNPRCARRIQENFETNGVRGVVVQKAVYKEPGRLKMDFSAASVLARISDNDAAGTEVEATTIDALIDDHFDGAIIDLLKIDIEGHELDALAGARRSFESRRVRHLYLECFDDDARRRLDDALRPFGFERTLTQWGNALYALKP